MALEGDLRVFRLPDILQMIAQQQKTGILTVQGEHDILAVSFLRGEIVAADALNQNFEEGLGEVLASQGLVRPEDFVRVAEGHKSSGQRLADYLVERGILSRQQLLGALRQQTYRLLLQVLRWTEGEFKFYSGEEVSFEDGVQPISVEEVLMRSIGESEMTPVQIWSRHWRLIPPFQAIAMASRAEAPNTARTRIRQFSAACPRVRFHGRHRASMAIRMTNRISLKSLKPVSN